MPRRDAGRKDRFGRVLIGPIALRRGLTTTGPALAEQGRIGKWRDRGITVCEDAVRLTHKAARSAEAGVYQAPTHFPAPCGRRPPDFQKISEIKGIAATAASLRICN